MLQHFLAVLATTPGMSSTPRLLCSEGDSRISRRPNFIPSRGAPLQQTCPGVQGLAKASQPLIAPISPSLCMAAWGTAAHTAALKRGPCPQQPHHLSKVGTPKVPPDPEGQELQPGCATGWEGAVVGGQCCSRSSSGKTLPPVPLSPSLPRVLAQQN